MKNLIFEIKRKKELSDIPDSLVEDILREYLKKNEIVIPHGKKGLKIILKDVRAELRKYTGRFQVGLSYKKRIELLQKNKITEILKTHRSSKERLDYYPKLIKKIERFNPQSILDLGCGINPLAIARKEIKYYAFDIKEKELDLINAFFKKNKINGKTFLKDIRQVEKFPKADICLIFKVLDILETKNHSLSIKILNKLNCKKIIVSFSTQTLSGKFMRVPTRKWFEKEITDGGYKIKETKLTKNEIFYFIEKLPHQKK